MMETKEMIYTAIFQNRDGRMSRYRYTGVIERRQAWTEAAKLGQSNGECLVALVPGDHPVHTYENTFDVDKNDRTSMKTHDVFEVPPDDESVFEMT